MYLLNSLGFSHSWSHATLYTSENKVDAPLCLWPSWTLVSHYALIKLILCIPQTGFVMEVNGDVSCVRGTVIVLLADTLAAHQLGGFKIGVGFSLRKCRQCMVTSDDMQKQVHSYLLITH